MKAMHTKVSWIGTLAVALAAIASAACEGGDDADLAVTEAALEALPIDTKIEGELAWALSFESKDAVAASAEAWACDSDDGDEYCQAVEPAYATYESGDAKLKLCQSYRMLRCPKTRLSGPGDGMCTVCCTVDLSRPQQVQCETRCRPCW